jgi:hypothetical protein
MDVEAQTSDDTHLAEIKIGKRIITAKGIPDLVAGAGHLAGGKTGDIAAH